MRGGVERSYSSHLFQRHQTFSSRQRAGGSTLRPQQSRRRRGAGPVIGMMIITRPKKKLKGRELRNAHDSIQSLKTMGVFEM